MEKENPGHEGEKRPPNREGHFRLAVELGIIGKDEPKRVSEILGNTLPEVSVYQRIYKN